MSKMKGQQLWLILFFLLFMKTSSAALLEEKWSYPTGAPDELFFEDLRGDGSKEIIFKVEDNLLILNSDGSLQWSWEKKNLISVAISDLDGNGEKEIVVSSGGRAGGIERAFLWILDKDGKVMVKYPNSKRALTILLTNIKALDLDGNGYKEIVSGTTKGVCTFTDAYDKILWCNRDKIKEAIKEIRVGDINGDGKGEILAKSFSTLYSVDNEGGVNWNYSVVDGIKELTLKDIYQEGKKRIIFRSPQKLSILDETGNLTKEIEIPKKTEGLFIENLDKDFYQEIVLVSEREITLLDDDLQEIANFSFSDKETIKSISLENIDLDKEKELVVFTNQKIYGFGENLTLNFSFELPLPAHKVFFLSKEMILINSQGVTYLFKINENFWRKRKGDEWYEKAKEYFNLNFYSNSSFYLKKAKEIYKEANYQEGLAKVEDLSQKIESKKKEEKNKLAELYYRRAEIFYNSSLYENASRELNLSKKLFLETNNVKGLLKCRNLEKKIREGKQTTTIETTTTLKEEVRKGNSGKLIFGAIILLIVLWLILKRKKKKIS